MDNVESSVQIDLIHTTKVSMQTNVKLIGDKGTQTEATPAYNPLVEKATNQKLHNELIQVQHELAQYRKEVVPLQEHQALLKRFKDLSTIEDETFA